MVPEMIPCQEGLYPEKLGRDQIKKKNLCLIYYVIIKRKGINEETL